MGTSKRIALNSLKEGNVVTVEIEKKDINVKHHHNLK